MITLAQYNSMLNTDENGEPGMISLADYNDILALQGISVSTASVATTSSPLFTSFHLIVVCLLIAAAVTYKFATVSQKETGLKRGDYVPAATIEAPVVAIVSVETDCYNKL